MPHSRRRKTSAAQSPSASAPEPDKFCGYTNHVYPFSFLKQYGPLILLLVAAWISVTIFILSLLPPGQRTVAAVERRLAAAVGVLEQSSSLSRVSALLAKEQDPLLPRSKTAGCVVAGPLPDRGYTEPGGQQERAQRGHETPPK